MKVKRLIACVLMASCLFAQTGITVNANDNISEGVMDSIYEIRSTYLQDARSSLAISGTTATCSSDASGTSSVTQIIGDMYLEKYVSGKWTAIDAWRLQQMGPDYSNTKTKTGLSSGSYRLRTEFTVTAKSGSETVTAYSGIKYVSSTSSSG